MANTGNTLPGTAENVDRGGLTAWTNPGNATADDGSDTTCNGAGSDYLVLRNFPWLSGAGIPTGATPQGFLARVEASEHSGGTEALHAQLQDASGNLIGDEKTVANEGNISGTTKAIYTFGSTSDDWGLGAAFTPSLLNDPDFGVRFWFTTSHDVRIDFGTGAVEYVETQDGEVTSAFQASIALPSEVTAPIQSAIALPSEVTSTIQAIIKVPSEITAAMQALVKLPSEVIVSVQAYVLNRITDLGVYGGPDAPRVFEPKPAASIPSQVTAAMQTLVALASEATAAVQASIAQRSEVTAAVQTAVALPSEVTADVEALVAVPGRVTVAMDASVAQRGQITAPTQTVIALPGHVTANAETSVALPGQVTAGFSAHIDTGSTPSEVTAAIEALIAGRGETSSMIEAFVAVPARVMTPMDAAIASPGRTTAPIEIIVALPGAIIAVAQVLIALPARVTAPLIADIALSGRTTAAFTADISVTSLPTGRVTASYETQIRFWSAVSSAIIPPTDQVEPVDLKLSAIIPALDQEE